MSYSEKAYKTMLKKAEQQKYNSAKDDSCISNLYYSAFQTTSALLIVRGKLFNKHTHVRGYVNKELAFKGLIHRELAKMYNKLMEFRSDADYNDEIFFDKNTANELLIGVRDFNQTIRNIIKEETD